MFCTIVLLEILVSILLLIRISPLMCVTTVFDVRYEFILILLAELFHVIAPLLLITLTFRLWNEPCHILLVICTIGTVRTLLLHKLSRIGCLLLRQLVRFASDLLTDRLLLKRCPSCVGTCILLHILVVTISTSSLLILR